MFLVYVNLINYMDRSTVAGMLDEIKRDKDFAIQKDKYLGLLQEIMTKRHRAFAFFSEQYWYLNVIHYEHWEDNFSHGIILVENDCIDCVINFVIFTHRPPLWCAICCLPRCLVTLVTDTPENGCWASA